MAKRVEDLPIFQRATEFCDAVIAILDRPAFHRNRRARDQISEACDSITSNMREGFEQPTDDTFSRYLFISKGALGEVHSRLASGQRKRYITPNELTTHTAAGQILGKMLGGFIKYLAKSGFKDRGRYKAKNPETNEETKGAKGRKEEKEERVG